MKDYYKILGVSPSASKDQIRDTFRKLAMIYHPDVANSDKYSEEKFKEIVEAYEVLSNDKLRSEYDQNHFGKTDDPPSRKASQSNANLDGNVILDAVTRIANSIAGYSSKQISGAKLIDALVKIFTVNNLNILVRNSPVDVRKRIVEVTLSFMRHLDYEQRKSLYSILIFIANKDQKIIDLIEQFRKKSRFQGVFGLILPFAVVGTILFLILHSDSNKTSKDRFSNPIRENTVTYSEEKEPKKRNYETGELNNSFMDEQITLPTEKSVPIKAVEDPPPMTEKEKLLADGWTENMFSNGEMPACYNFKPRKEDIDNYLLVSVGTGTDVVLKLVNLRTNVCIRYVYIKGGSKYYIRGIPEDKYYVKIAYGRDWMSKVEGDRCIGKFTKNALYEKGEDILDYNFIQEYNGYSVPSYSLQLDVISTDIQNAFDSHNISEDEFNK